MVFQITPFPLQRGKRKKKKVLTGVLLLLSLQPQHRGPPWGEQCLPCAQLFPMGKMPEPRDSRGPITLHRGRQDATLEESYLPTQIAPW